MIETLVEVKLDQEEDFLKVKETLTRIGIASRKDKTLYQSCHILHKQSKYYIVHFKQLFALDGKQTDFSEEDKARTNTIIALLQDWSLIKVCDAKQIEQPRAALSKIKIISFKEKPEWTLIAKYTMGKKSKQANQLV